MEEDDQGGIPISEPPPKRRRVHDDSVDSTPRYGSPTERLEQNLSIRRARPSSRSRSRSVSPRPRSDDGDADDSRKRYRSSTPSSSRSRSRSRRRSQTRSRSRSRSYTQSRSRSHSPRSRRSRSLSRSVSTSRSRSKSRSRSSSSRRSLGSQDAQPRRLSQIASDAAAALPVCRQPRYHQKLVLKGHIAAVSQVRISPDGRWIASASADGTARIWDAETGAHLNTLVGHMAGVSCLAWAPDSDTLATGSDDKAIRLWDRVTADPAHACGQGGRTLNDSRSHRAATETRGGRTGKGPLLGHHNYVYCLAFSPKGNILASGSYDEAVFLWDVRAGRLMRSLPAHSDPVSGIDFCRDGTLVVSCSTDGLIRVWDTSTGQCLRTLVHEDNPAVTNVCFGPNGRFVLAFSLDNSIRLWDYVSGSVKKTYQGHKNKGFSIGGCFGAIREAEADGEEHQLAGQTPAFIASASEDGDIVLWDVRTKQIVQRIERAHKGVCFWVDVNDRTMVSAGQDAIIKVYRGQGVPAEPELVNGVNLANGLNDHGHVNEKGELVGVSSADDELQRQIGEEAGSPYPHVKEEQL